MKLDDILSKWSDDCVIDDLHLMTEISQTTPKLHSFYLSELAKEKLKLAKLEEDRKILIRHKSDYYLGTIDQETLKEKNWIPFRLKILKSELSSYIDSDADIIKLNLEISLQSEKVFVLESIMKQIGGRGFLIRSLIDEKKFLSGS